VAILVAAAIERYARAGGMLAALLGAVCIWQSMRYFTGPHENWEAAASAIAKHVERGACLVVAPREDARFYEFFQQRLSRADCRSPTMVLAITPYTTIAQQQTAVARLLKDRYTSQREAVVGGSVIALFRSLPGRNFLGPRLAPKS
jgi:hypothetical protein